ncbi:MAG TPA: DUF4331 family protein [Myxococcaceae bacterium]|nr:DUF4331 family protein [Myxococcaceae bacterium]
MQRFDSGRAAWLAATLIATTALAADHQDGAAVLTDPSTDINDVFAWTSTDGSRLNLVMDVFPAATTAAKFSNVAQYVFHTTSSPAYGMPAAASEDILCTFDTSQVISCWGGGEYVHGDASNTAGIASASGKLRVFAGLRDDPFFFNLDGFKATAAAVHDAAGSLTSDAAGCPALDATTSSALVTQLKSAPGGGPPSDHFKGLNTLSIVVQIDKSLVTKGGTTVGVWASTNK